MVFAESQNLLETSTHRYPTQTALARQLASLYGAYVNLYVNRLGTLHTVRLRASFVNNRFVDEDLSAKDPYYITPIVMGITMFLQQKMTPTTADPMQQKIFLAMPVIFTFLFINFQSGLVLYWLTNNVLSIIQQYVINKRK